jgi:ADP-ribosylglycohydrolase
VGTLINSMCFASDVGHGLCILIAQGNDTDCFGKIVGSLLGAYLGPGNLDERWLEPFGDDIRTTVAGFCERSLSAVAARMGQLPRRIW